jgi:hypothetical protein
MMRPQAFQALSDLANAQNQARFTVLFSRFGTADRLNVLEAVAGETAICGTVASASGKRTTVDPLRS